MKTATPHTLSLTPPRVHLSFQAPAVFSGPARSTQGRKRIGSHPQAGRRQDCPKRQDREGRGGCRGAGSEQAPSTCLLKNMLAEPEKF